MPTPTQVANRSQPAPDQRHYTATVTAAGPPVKVALDPGGAVTVATALAGATYAVGHRVLVLVTAAGNFILGRITP